MVLVVSHIKSGAMSHYTNDMRFDKEDEIP